MKGGLGKWFGEQWVDIKSGAPCGRSGEKRSYPACRPKKAAEKMTPAQKSTMARKKQGPQRQRWPISPTGKKQGAT